MNMVKKFTRTDMNGDVKIVSKEKFRKEKLERSSERSEWLRNWLKKMTQLLKPRKPRKKLKNWQPKKLSKNIKQENIEK